MKINDIDEGLFEAICDVLNEDAHNYRDLSSIAFDISKDWKPVNYAAKPYLDAMHSLHTMKDDYGMDSAQSIIAYFLSNASQWKGETAKRIKLELKAMLAGKPVAAVKEEFEGLSEEEQIEEMEAAELRAMVAESGSALAVFKSLKQLPDGDQWENRHEVTSKSSGKKYVVSQNKKHGNWGCSCRGWTTHRHCKHLGALGLD